jgi:hypothetical protein
LVPGGRELPQPMGMQTICFRGKGMRITALEKASWDKRVNVQFQECAWYDRKTCIEWSGGDGVPDLLTGKGTLKRLREDDEAAGDVGGEYLSVLDNLDGQTTRPFKKACREACNALTLNTPPGCTDDVQAFDAGAGRDIKLKMGDVMDEWLMNDSNLEKWEDNKLTASDRRILMTKWFAEACERVFSPRNLYKTTSTFSTQGL